MRWIFGLIRRLIWLVVVIALCLLAIWFWQGKVAGLNGNTRQEKLETIAQNCGEIGEKLKKVQIADARERFYLGKTYERASSSFIIPLNLSLVKETLSSEEFIKLQGLVTKKREEFNKGFITYSQKLEGLMNLDCKNNASEFYDKLSEVRKSRETVLKYTEEMRELLSRYGEKVKELKKNLKTGDKEVIEPSNGTFIYD